MMRETNGPDGETAQIDVTYLVYLHGREDPVNVPATFDLRKEILNEGKELENFAQVAVNHILGTIDIVREHRLIFSDRLFNKFIFLTDQVQAVSVLVPDEQTLLRLLEE